MPFVFPIRIAVIASLSLAGIVSVGVRPAAAQETIYGFTTGNTLFNFASTTPGTITTVGSITGLSGTLQDIDFRPSNGLLYGLTTQGATFNVYTISTTTGAATLVTSLTGVSAGSAVYDIDFNPQANALRIVGTDNQNLRVPGANLVTGGGATTSDTALTIGGSPASNTTNILGGAYTNNFSGATSTTLYDLGANGQLYSQGAVGGGAAGTAASPNSGILNALGATTLTGVGFIGFDISGVTGNAYAVGTNANGVSTFYNINLATPASSPTGSALGINNVAGIAAPIGAAVNAPEPGSVALLSAGLISLAGVVTVRRRKTA